jgi:RNA polymerase sigma factor (TIGR02999 family)
MVLRLRAKTERIAGTIVLTTKDRVTYRLNGSAELDGQASADSAQSSMVHAQRPMSDSHDDTVQRLLEKLRAGDRRAFDDLFPLVYEELRRAAGRQRRRWDGDDSLNTTALVHEAYLRLAGTASMGWRNQPHFLAVASKAMRQILIDNAKRRRAAKRGGGLRRVPIEEIETALKSGGDASEAGADALVALEDALIRLEAHDARQSRIVECRFFGGMAIEETATALGVSPATVKRGWAMAQAWLYRELATHPEVAT